MFLDDFDGSSVDLLVRMVLDLLESVDSLEASFEIDKDSVVGTAMLSLSFISGLPCDLTMSSLKQIQNRFKAFKRRSDAVIIHEFGVPDSSGKHIEATLMQKFSQQGKRSNQKSILNSQSAVANAKDNLSLDFLSINAFIKFDLLPDLFEFIEDAKA